METLKLINGNKQPMVKDLPKLFIFGEINEVALNHIRENTGLEFTKKCGGLEAQPIASHQIVALFLTYNFKTQYNDNLTIRNTLLLKSDHHVGFNVESICFDCVKHNRIVTNGLKQGDRLSA
jgi:heme/copper-type cytochrome/quinol oxidase subunit 2